ncbi:sodium/mannose cotransporter SLC5A10-like [Babylonia areolata]|uniref:sodium/mannose cotransporter SLC5A10-like n=1 Tax=Babylonia areolata TaxID=304850 RepID=UPI003FCF8DDE
MEGGRHTPGLEHAADIAVVVIYFVLVLAVGLWSLCRPNRGSVNSYFLAGRNMAWWPVGASLFSSNIGSEHFVGLAGTGAAAGIAMVMYEWNSMLLVILLGWLFLPVYMSAGVYTLPEYMEKRFGGARLRVYLSCLSLVLYIVTKLAVSVYAGALFIKLALAWDMYISIAGLLLITGVYTVLGGLAAVIYTDTFQTAVMTVGAIILSVISFQKIGGYEALQEKYFAAIPSHRPGNSSTCGVPQADAFHIFRDPLHSDNPWPGLLWQSSVGCMWYWCCDQVIVQRSLSARSLSHAKAGSILAGYLKLTPLFFMIFPGMISRALFPDTVGCVDPQVCQEVCENAVGCSNIAYPKLVLELLPLGLRGLLMAVMLSAIMSSLTSIFNSSATLFTMDLWRRFRQTATERELLIVGRLFVLLLCVVSIFWIPLVKSSQGGQLFNYIQAVQGYLGTPIGALFIMAILWKRMNERGAFLGILSGHVCGVIRMAMDFAYPGPGCDEEETRPPVLFRVHYTYFGLLNFLVSVLAIVLFTYTDRQQPEDQLRNMTWWTRVDKMTDAQTDGTDQWPPTGDSPSLSPSPSCSKAAAMQMEMMATEEGGEVDGKPDGEGERRADDEEEEEDGAVVTVEEGRCHRLFDTVCGIPTTLSRAGQKPGVSEDQRREFLRESSGWSFVLNVNAAIAMCVMAFLTGYYH